MDDPVAELVAQWMGKALDDMSAVALLADDIRLLNPFASAYRYPGMLEVPTTDEAERAFAAAARIVEFVAVRLPCDTSS